MRFLFADKITEISERHIKGIKSVSFEEGFIDPLSAEEGSFPRLLMMESAGQFVSWLIFYITGFKKIPLIASIDLAEIRGSVKCGECIRVEVIMESINSEGAVVNSMIYKDEKLVAAGNRCLCTFVDAEKLVDAARLKSRFLEMAKEAVYSK
ncbi:MAG TPA: hypothetical protein VHO03_00905 [Ignavibacteriales bacterium]|nr:hypothetical protein [Ignavibacteriales bacterium]